jgi:hypothetical protein
MRFPISHHNTSDNGSDSPNTLHATMKAKIRLPSLSSGCGPIDSRIALRNPLHHAFQLE